MRNILIIEIARRKLCHTASMLVTEFEVEHDKKWILLVAVFGNRVTKSYLPSNEVRHQHPAAF
jgi:hypothetical protein